MLKLGFMSSIEPFHWNVEFDNRNNCHQIYVQTKFLFSYTIETGSGTCQSYEIMNISWMLYFSLRYFEKDGSYVNG